MLATIGTAGFMMCVVFAVLLGIYLCVKGFSFITMKIEDKIKETDVETKTD